MKKERKNTCSNQGCTRLTNGTILFAYSTDILQDDLTNALEEVGFIGGYSGFANVRFDVKEVEEIEYHYDLLGLQTSVRAHPANSSIGYQDSKVGSDVFNMIKRFLDNDRQLCGSMVYVLVKRLPNKVDVTDLLNQLQRNHVFVYFIVNNFPSGGFEIDSLFKIASRTNGYCIFAGADYRQASLVGEYPMGFPYQFVAQNYHVQGSGRIETPPFEFPNADTPAGSAVIAITLQDHPLTTNFISLNCTITTVNGDPVYSGPNAAPIGNAFFDLFSINRNDEYKITIDYEYKYQNQTIEVRVYHESYNDFLPFAN